MNRRPHPVMAQLLAERELQGLSQNSLAKLAARSQGTIASAETGKRTPSIDVVDDIALALGYRLTLTPVLPKICHTCQRARVPRDFGHDTTKSDGLTSSCRECLAATRRSSRAQSRSVAEVRRQSAMKGRAVRTARTAAKFAAYAELRGADVDRQEAARRVGIAATTARRYERRMREQVPA